MASPCGLEDSSLIRKTLGINLKLTIIQLTKEIVQSVIMFGYLNLISVDSYFSIIFLVLSLIKKKISNMNNCGCGSLTKFRNASKFHKKKLHYTRPAVQTRRVLYYVH